MIEPKSGYQPRCDGVNVARLSAWGFRYSDLHDSRAYDGEKFEGHKWTYARTGCGPIL